jgi:hypothetical protein
MGKMFKEQAAEARSAGLTTFIADRPCTRGHPPLRYSCNRSHCVECQRLNLIASRARARRGEKPGIRTRTTIRQQAAEARAAGMTTFVSDTPCRHGHAPLRYASADGPCVACCELNQERQRERRGTVPPSLGAGFPLAPRT